MILRITKMNERKWKTSRSLFSKRLSETNKKSTENKKENEKEKEKDKKEKERSREKK